jgi:hypothetical protein
VERWDEVEGYLRTEAELDLEMTGVEVKKPGDARWFQKLDPRAMQVMDVRCPDGSTRNLRPVFPQE